MHVLLQHRARSSSISSRTSDLGSREISIEPEEILRMATPYQLV